MWQNHLNKYNITQHNFKYTHFRPNQKPSCIDHLYSNCPNHINNVSTHTNGISDHSIITANYSTKHEIVHPKYIKVRNWKSLTNNKIQNAIDQSDLMNSIFNYTDPNIVANIIQLELNAIIDTILLPKIIQYNKKYVPYFNESIRNKIKTRDKLLSTAIETKDNEDWRSFRNQRNNLEKEIKETKKSYLMDKFQNNKDKWRTSKEVNNNK